jgi:flagellum-specific peptidoglycan hydrolase FlgJ
MLTDGASKQIIVNLKAGKINAEEANRQILLAAAARKRQFKDMTFSAETLAQYGLSAKMMDNINRELARTAEGYADLSQDQRDQMEADLDAQRSAEVQRQITERNAEQSKDRFLQLVGKGLAPAFEKLMEIVNRLGKALATFVKFITFGKVDMTDLYDSPQDKIRKRQDEIRDLEAKKEHAGYNGQGGYDESQRALEQADLEKQIQAKKEEIARMKREMGIENNQAAIDKAQAEVKMNEARIRAEKELTLKQMNLTEDRLDKASDDDKKAFADQLAKNHKEWTIQLDKSREKLLEEMKKSDEAIAEGFNANRSGGSGSTPFNGSSKEFYDKMYSTLLEKAKKAGVENPEAIARLGAAQSALETGYGKKTAGGNNFFGIKAKPGDANAVLNNTQEWDAAKGRYVTVQAGFRKYNSMDESAEDYIKFLQENQRYKEVLGSRTAEQAIAAQGRSGYATDPSYSRKLAEIHSRGTAPGAASGGIFSGPPNGYPVMLHGNEMVIPMPNREALAAITQVNRKPLPEVSDAGLRSQSIDFSPFIKVMSEKLDELISHARDSHSTQEELLRHARN